MEEYFIFRRQWEKVMKPINIRNVHPKYLTEVPEGYLSEEGKIVVSLYKGEKIGNIKSWDICECCIKYNMYKEALSAVPDGDDIVHGFYNWRCMDGQRYLRDLGSIGERELRAYEICMNPEDRRLIDVLDDDDEEDMEIYDLAIELVTTCFFAEMPWDRDAGQQYHYSFSDIGCTDTSWERLLERALRLDLRGIRKERNILGACTYDTGTLEYSYPQDVNIWDIKSISDVDMTLFFWTKYEM